VREKLAKDQDAADSNEFFKKFGIKHIRGCEVLA